MQTLSTAASLSDAAVIAGHRRIVLLTEGHSNLQFAKTAIGVVRYRGQDVAAILDSENDGKVASDCFDSALLGEFAHSVPVISDFGQLDPSEPADALYVGIAMPGGKLPDLMRAKVANAIAQGMDVVTGMHQFLCDDQELKSLADISGARLIDVRRNQIQRVASGDTPSSNCLRIHTVGQDCSVGKMVASVAIERALTERGEDVQFLATGQTGIMVEGTGIPIDAIVSDFVAGAAEQLVREHAHHDFVVIEGQGSVVHPAYSGVTVGLLHGSTPDALVLCYEAGREATKSFPQVPLASLAQIRSLIETLANARHPCRFIGVAMNSRRLTVEEALAEKQTVEEELGLPVCDVVRDGAGPLVDAAIQLKRELAGSLTVSEMGTA